MHTSRSRRAFLATALFGFMGLLTLTGCGNGGSHTIYDGGVVTGIQGQVTRGPLSPLIQLKQSNTAPLAGVVVTFLAPDGTERARQTTDSKGNYIISLPPGTYQVQGLAPSGSQGFPAPPPAQTVTVANLQIVTVNLAYDTGIR